MLVTTRKGPRRLFIVTEATQVSQQGQGYAWTPGIHSREQVEGWRLVTDAVHKAGGLIFLQLWHVGRISHPSLQPDGMLPVAPSAIKASGEAFIENENGEGELVPFVTPRALQIEEMPYIVRQYARGSRNALEAGFDGVEVHAANGYLLDQFINSRSNHRADGYGGAIENRARLLMEVVEAVSDVWGQDRVGVRLSPLGTFNDMGDDDPETTFGYVAEKLNGGALAYLHIVNPAVAAIEKGIEPDPGALRMLEMMRERYRGTLIIAGGFDYDTAEGWLRQGKADLIARCRREAVIPRIPRMICYFAAQLGRLLLTEAAMANPAGESGGEVLASDAECGKQLRVLQRRLPDGALRGKVARGGNLSAPLNSLVAVSINQAISKKQPQFAAQSFNEGLRLLRAMRGSWKWRYRTGQIDWAMGRMRRANAIC
jgi:N-ethylmaleimide reductase